MKITIILKVELAVLVFPLAFGGDGLHHVPMLGDFAVLDAEEVVVAGGLVGELAFAYGEDEVAAAEDFVDGEVFHLDALLGHGGEGGSEAVKSVGDGGVVLDVIVAVKVALINLHPHVSEMQKYSRFRGWQSN